MALISTFFADGNKGRAVVSNDPKTGNTSIDYYDDHGRHFFREDYVGKSIQETENLAEDWALGYKHLEETE